MKNGHCVCPYLPCPIRGNCQACCAISIKVKEFPNCLEPLVEERGGYLPRKRPTETLVCDTFELMSQKTADMIASSVREKPDALLCLAAGATAARAYAILAEMSKRNEVDFSQARFVQLDEWLDLEDRSENCAAFLEKHFFNPLNISIDKMMRFRIDAADLAAECDRMDHWILAEGGIDFMLLGIGMNGHVALNEPGESFDSGAKVVELSAKTSEVGQKYFSKSTNLKRGITLGMRQVFNSKVVVLQAGTAAKAEIVAKTYATLPQLSIPATVMFLVKTGYVVLDKDAASLIAELE